MMKQRYKYVDLFKFIGITLMIMGHVGFGNSFNKFIHAFHMPMFFVASGYCFSSGRKFAPFFAKKCKTIMIPYLAFSIITFLALKNINMIQFASVQHVLWLNNVDTPIAGVWFLTALFWANLLYWLIDRLPSDDAKWLASLMAFLIGATIEKTMGVFLPLSTAQGLVGVLFVHIGKCLSRFETSKRTPLWMLVIGIAFFSALIFLNEDVNVRLSRYDNLALFLINAVGMSSLLMIVSRRLDRLTKSQVYDVICSVGKNSICYLGLNQIAIRYARALADKVIPEKWGNAKSAFILATAYFSMYLAAALITRTGLAVLIGNFNQVSFRGNKL